MKKFISAVTSLCMAATMTGFIVPASINAADASKGLIMKTFDQADSKYADAGSKVTVSAEDIAAGDVVIPCAVYLDESTTDVTSLALRFTVKDTSAEASKITLKSYHPSDDYFDAPKTFTTASGETFTI
ncbi:MAG TPA: hypothetical protein RWO09_01495, partial [Ruminococcus sp.]